MNINFNANNDGLVPAVIQDSKTRAVLMLGYMNEESYGVTLQTKKVTFFSRSRNRIWTKGEESGNFLQVVSIKSDCDQDSLLISAKPAGPTCHTLSDTCWDEKNSPHYGFLSDLEATIEHRKNAASDSSYVSSLFRKGINKIAQKVGEEAIETILEAKDQDDGLFLNESADLLFHYLILLQSKGFKLDDVVGLLERRKKP